MLIRPKILPTIFIICILLGVSINYSPSKLTNEYTYAKTIIESLLERLIYCLIKQSTFEHAYNEIYIGGKVE